MFIVQATDSFRDIFTWVRRKRTPEDKIVRLMGVRKWQNASDTNISDFSFLT
jgi:hypothetical protein